MVLGFGIGGLRKRVSRQMFYYVHVAIVLVMMLVTFFHVEFTRPFVIGVFLVWGVDLFLLTRSTGDGSTAGS